MIQRAGNIIITLLLFIAFFTSCNSEKEEGQALFSLLDSKKTGIDFSNDLSYNKEFNLFKYMYFYNGSGVGAADFNNDGLTDLFFGSNQHNNKLYLNQGGLQFKDISKDAGIPADGGWTTGISVVDINNDGLMDIYVCRVGKYEILQSKNQLLINQGLKNGVPTFVDQAAAYGLNFSGFSTQAAFFDHDNDGDLDLFLLNHSVHENGTFRPRKEFTGTRDMVSGDRIFRNDGNVFVDVTEQTGISSTAIGYGLGVVVADINVDGYPDIYVGNDFHENDYLYINRQNGSFRQEGEERMMHSSQFSMGVDVADINNDAFPEIISADMLPADPYILKRSLGEDALDIFNYKISVGYAHQYTRNNLQYNRRNGMFSETGLYSGIAATDWSWAPLWMDFDNDGLKDLFISNGIPKRMNDIDYINFVTHGEIQQMIRDNNMQGKDLALINKFPEIKLPNKFYRNNGDLSFTDEEKRIEGNLPTFSNGAVYADLDNDGDLDIVVNNIDAPAMLYENKKNKPGERTSVAIHLKGDAKNINAIGARVMVYTKQEVRTYEKYPVKGFLSSMEQPLLIGLENTVIDSVLLVWPDRSYQHLSLSKDKPAVYVQYREDLPLFNFSSLTHRIKNSTLPMADITHTVNFDYQHQENQFAEFDREPLIPHMLSTEGPALAIHDINHDGLDDVFIGSSRNKKPIVFLQQASGKFSRSAQPVLDADSMYENTSACFTDVNNDGHSDLVVASGGNEFFGTAFQNTPRVYLNDGKGSFSKLENAFGNLYLTASTVVAHDFNGDGFADLFIGARAVPWEYGQVPQSYLLINDKTGRFTDVTKTLAPELSLAGFVTHALWYDLDKDGDQDLLLALEWGGIEAFINDKGKFTKKTLTAKKGWWNVVLPVDIDNDGDIDLVAGNLGLNSRLKASEKEPLRLYFNDFDGNGKKEQVLTYYLQGKEIPFANKSELEKQMPVLKKKFLYAGDFAKATLQELFTAEKLNGATLLTADYLSSAILVNQGNLQFEVKALPAEAQFSSIKAAVVVDADHDNLPDILLMGNYYNPNIEMGRYDADFGTILLNKGQGNFMAETINGLVVKGQVRNIKPVNIGKQPAFILARNNDSAMVIKFGERQQQEKGNGIKNP